MNLGSVHKHGLADAEKVSRVFWLEWFKDIGKIAWVPVIDEDMGLRY
jgi:hypothetical protein